MSLIILMTAVLITPMPYIESVKLTLQNCYTTLIPSLYIFMCLSQIFCETSAGNTVSAIISHLTKKLFRLNKNETKIMLLSLLGGYPCGAKLIANSLKNGEIKQDSATRLLKFCVNPSPSYMILAVGSGIYQNTEIGMVFFLSNTAVSLLTALLTRPKSTVKETKTHQLPLSQSLVKSVSDSTNAMLLICGFSLFFTVVITFLKSVGLFLINRYLTAIIASSLDVVTGVGITSRISFFLTAAAISFGGISVVFQCMAMLKDTNLNFLKIIPTRILTSLLTGMISYFIIRIKDFPIETITTLKPSISAQTPTLSLLFVLTCAMFLVSIKRSNGNYEKTFRKQN